jgi:ABC-type uncharacterized transport system involved in gliding motility auxiliary subunit
MARPTLSRSTIAILALVCAVVLFVAVNVLADRTLRTTRIDLTDGHLYTLSKGSLDTLSKLDEPITLRFYYSPRLGDEVPSLGIYAQRVREMLEEYAALARGKIDLQILNPEPFSPVEDRAVAFGLQGVPVDSAGEQVYFGLAGTNSTDDQQVIAFFQPERERFLEYDLTKLIHSLAFPKRPVVGLVTTLPLQGDFMAAMQGRPLQPYVIVDQMEQLYDVHTLGVDFDKVPADVDVLMIVQPQGLQDKTLYAIDQFVLKGGRAIVFVDPDSETQRVHPTQMSPPGGPSDSDLEKLFAAWGVVLAPKLVAADRQAAMRVTAGTESRQEPMDYVGYLALTQANINRDNPITADLSHVNVATAGFFKPLDNAKTKFTPLLQTSTDSQAIGVDKFKGMPDVAGLLHDFKPGGKPLVIAAEITGPADTAFPEGLPVDKAAATKPTGDKAKEADPAAPQVKASVKPINVVVVADTDILDDRFWVQTQDFLGRRVAVPNANNGDFVFNTIDVLVGGEDLVGLRSRGTSARPFALVQQIQRDADEQWEATQKDLEDKLKAAQAKIKEASEQGGGANGALSPEQTQVVDNFRAEMLRIRQQLRQVQLAEREDINRLKAALEFFDIGFIPIIVAVVAIIVGAVRMRRRKRRARAA